MIGDEYEERERERESRKSVLSVWLDDDEDDDSMDFSSYDRPIPKLINNFLKSGK